MSAPAANAFSPPVRTIAPTSLSASRELRCVFSSVINGVDKALRAFGRLSSISATRGRGLLGAINVYVDEKRKCLRTLGKDVWRRGRRSIVPGDDEVWRRSEKINTWRSHEKASEAVLQDFTTQRSAGRSTCS